ncbi:MAG: SWIM zinc finger family protein [Chloroflexota bacterium]
MKIAWTSEQIIALAQDKYGVRAGRTLSTAEKWQFLGQCSPWLWGMFPTRSKKPPLQTSIDLSSLRFFCTCPDKKYPCSHALALLLLYQDRPEVFPEKKKPTWVQTTAISKPIPQKPNRDTQSDFAALQTGLDALEQWLYDLMRNGLAALQSQPKQYWIRMADRLVDARAPTLADEIRALPNIVGQDDDWPEPLLARLGQLHLLIEGFKRFDQLALATQADLKAAVGWSPAFHHADPPECIQDRWQVLGWRGIQRRKHKLKRFWLWGEAQQRPAFIDMAFDFSDHGCVLVPGGGVKATLRFYPSTTPLQATLFDTQELYQPQKTVPALASIKAVGQQYAQLTAQNPWLPAYPFIIQNSQATLRAKQWFIVDDAGFCLPLPEKFEQGWHLQAVSQDHESRLFGEWNGETFLPLSLWTQGTWHSLHTLKGIR